MSDYYKAVRVDGTDFATGTTRPVLGEWMPRIKPPLVMCKRGYHVSDAPGETLIGGSWPCRLFRVEIKDRKPKQEGHKYVVSTYRPVEELPAWQALGPNGKAVAALIEQARNLTPEQVRQLAAAGNAAGAAAWYAALAAARAAARDAARVAAWDAARAAARDAARAAAWDAARAAAWDAARAAAWDAARVAAWDAAGVAAWAAARALVVRDLITPEHFTTLYGPWASVLGAPTEGEAES